MDPLRQRDALHVVTRGAARTQAVGAALGALLSPGTLVTLSGPLGAGKTTFAQGLARGLGIVEPIVSPTYTLVREYAGGGGRPDLWHADLYRVGGAREAAELGLGDGLGDGAVVAVEWPEHGATELAALERIDVALAPLAEPDARRIDLRAHGEAAQHVLGLLAGRLAECAGVDVREPSS